MLVRFLSVRLRRSWWEFFNEIRWQVELPIEGRLKLASMSDVLKGVDFKDQSSVLSALERMKEVHYFELIQFVVIGEMLNTTAQETRVKVALARAEKERRDMDRAECFATKTMVTSTLIGAAAVVIGAIIGALLTSAI
ncbi:hypothetical protein [Albibacillus kandeliae]|uniref:hypothetical protein n=1 Tax=Albibacillus kandeliae TaxID=2174228 RepID=UPI00130097A5|nr:hypothetical protein [Albibacillus kandeliae]